MNALRQYFKMITEHPLGSKHPIRCASRILRWQFAGRLSDGGWVVNYVGGQRLLLYHGETGLTVHYYTGLYEFEDMLFVYHALRDGDLFIDVGANAGAYSVLASGAAGARAIAFEPVPKTFDLLCDNVALNGLSQRVQALNVAVGSREGQLSMTTGLAAQNRVAVDATDSSQKIAVPVVTLDAATADQIAQDGAIVLKIDVEGWEKEVLEGAGALLSSQQPLAVLVEMNQSGQRYGHPDEELRAMLVSHGLIEVAYDPWNRKISREGTPAGPNRLFVSNVRFFDERVERARTIDIWGHAI